MTNSLERQAVPEDGAREGLKELKDTDKVPGADTDFDIGTWDTDINSSDSYQHHPCPDYDGLFGKRYSQLYYHASIMREEDSFSLAALLHS